MKFPGAPYGLKMACGENPKRVYGARNQSPSTRMGNIAVARQAWIDAQRATVDAWLAGTAVPPPRAYHRILNILKKADPQYRPL